MRMTRLNKNRENKKSLELLINANLQLANDFE